MRVVHFQLCTDNPGSNCPALQRTSPVPVKQGVRRSNHEGGMSMLTCHPATEGGPDTLLIRRRCSSECCIAKASPVSPIAPCTMPIIRTLGDLPTEVLTPPLPLLSSLTPQQFCNFFQVPRLYPPLPVTSLKTAKSRFSAADANTRRPSLARVGQCLERRYPR